MTQPTEESVKALGNSMMNHSKSNCSGLKNKAVSKELSRRINTGGYKHMNLQKTVVES